MKKALLLLALAAINFAVHAQQVTTNVTRIKLDSATVVKDSLGLQYPYLVWRKMMSSGDYMLRPISPGDVNTTFVLSKITAGQKDDMIARSPKPAESSYFTTGESFKFYKDRAIDGYKIVPEELAGKVVVLNFWFVNCAPCRAEIPELNHIANKYKDNKDVVFIAAALDQGYEVKDFVKTNPFDYHLIADSRALAAKYGIKAYPTNVIIDKHGKVRFHSTGYGNGTAHWIKKTIEELKAE